jgi:hypothetical protein
MKVSGQKFDQYYQSPSIAMNRAGRDVVRYCQSRSSGPLRGLVAMHFPRGTDVNFRPLLLWR